LFALIETFDDVHHLNCCSKIAESSQQRRKQRIERHKLLTLQQYDLNMKNLIINNINDLTNTLRKTKIMKNYNDESSENIFHDENERSENEQDNVDGNRLDESSKTANGDEDEDEYVVETFEQTFVDVVDTQSTPNNLLNRSNEKLFNINEEIHELFKHNDQKHANQNKQTCIENSNDNNNNIIEEEEENQADGSERDEHELNNKLEEFDERNILIVNKDSISSMSSVGIGSTTSSTSSLSICSNNPSPNSTINKSFKKSPINNELFYTSSMFPYVYSNTNPSVQGMFCY